MLLVVSTALDEIICLSTAFSLSRSAEQVLPPRVAQSRAGGPVTELIDFLCESYRALKGKCAARFREVDGRRKVRTTGECADLEAAICPISHTCISKAATKANHVGASEAA